jgi:hypothetical protein
MKLHEFLHYFLKPTDVQMELENGKWVNAVPEGDPEPLSGRLRGAWRVLLGKSWHVELPSARCATDLSCRRK